MSSNFKNSLKNEANQNLSIQKNALLSRLLVGEISPTPGHLDDRIRLILDEGIAFAGDLSVVCRYFYKFG